MEIKQIKEALKIKKDKIKTKLNLKSLFKFK